MRKSKLLEEFERELIKKQKYDIIKNIEIFNELLDFARQMGIIPPADPLEGIEIDIKYARVINGLKGTTQGSSKGT